MKRDGTKLAGLRSVDPTGSVEGQEAAAMTEKMTAARVRIAVATLLHRRGIDVGDLYRALGIDPSKAESEALSHLAGVLDGLEAAADDSDFKS